MNTKPTRFVVCWVDNALVEEFGPDADPVDSWRERDVETLDEAIRVAGILGEENGGQYTRVDERFDFEFEFPYWNFERRIVWEDGEEIRCP